MKSSDYVSTRFGKVITAMITPFNDDMTLDLPGAVQLAKWLEKNGSDGLVLAGTTGEGPVLNDNEKIELFREVSSSVGIPVIANTGSNDTEHSIELTKRASATNIAAILAVTPYYSRPPQSGIEMHFKAVAAATSLPVIIYDIPVRTGRKVEYKTLKKLLTKIDNIVGVKDAAGDVVETSKLMHEVPEAEIYSGDDALTFALVCHGAKGVIGVATHWCGHEMFKMIRYILEGKLGEARKIHNLMLDSFMFETSLEAPNPIPAKAVMKTLGLPSGKCRLPLGEVESVYATAEKIVEPFKSDYIF
jgi:4-hydroxy-tetrahydrodipicolinate synthase